MKYLSIKISGKVQGVFFRASTKEAANTFGVTGFVRNERDGSVYIEAEGEEEALQKFIAWCHRGPSKAVVEQVVVKEEKVQNFVKFEIRH